ncbi:MAG: cation-transporting P-type ATPase [Parvibaculum sp.]|nr:cation-transporting P-type ATPase [Parvibaculum sp.]
MEAPKELLWHSVEAREAFPLLGAEETGLNGDEARRRLAEHGPNRLPQGKRRGPIARFFRQLNNLLIYVLIAAAVLSLSIGHATDAVVIALVVLVNSAIGFIQEGRAEKALEAIRSMIDPHASVLRDGRRISVAAEDVVPGDMVLLEAGDRVPADLRLVKASNLRIDEAALTGESVPVDKAVAAVDASAALGDRLCMAYSGTFVAAGQGTGIAVATGAGTELGRISSLLGEVEALATPLTRKMDQFARTIAMVALALAGSMFIYAALGPTYDLSQSFMILVGILVASIPEGLPAVMTITLAVGVQRMAGRNAVIRRLPAVETLGSVSIICSDKTGTLTKNEMTVGAVVTASAHARVEGAGYEPVGRFLDDGAAIDVASYPVMEELALAGLLCNDAALAEREGRWVTDGDSMEGALLSLAMKAGHDVTAARARFVRLGEIPFDARHRYMAVMNRRDGGAPVLYLKGAPERVIDMCETAATADGTAAIDRVFWLQQIDKLAAEGQRVIALAKRLMPEEAAEIATADAEVGLTLLGLVALIDPPRPEAITAIAECREAGIAVKMITGDHAATASAIARQLGMGSDVRTVTGLELDAMGDAEFAQAAREACVFARTSPEHKLRLVEALQADGSVIAMTGDGVNDAPALKRADIGVAMGGKGTEAAKEASEVVLADDNFASIVAAVREGRTVYDNLTKIISWVLPTNGGEALTILLAVLIGLTLPVLPLQILWINMVTGVALGLTFAFEPTEPGAMKRAPRPPGQAILSGRVLWRIFFVSLLMVSGTFGIFAWAMERGLTVETARTMVVNAIVVMEIFYLFSVRYVHGTSLTWRGVLGTRAVLIGVTGITAAQFAFTYLPFLQKIFHSAPVAFADGLVIVGIGVALLIVVEIEKRIAMRLGFAR